MALTETYVDPSIAGASGAGTIGDPYGDLQHGLDDMTRDSTEGDRINIKAGTDEVATAAINLTSYGTPTEPAPILFQGYTSAAGDGGIFGIDGNNGAYPIFGFSGISHTHFASGHMHNSQQQAITANARGTYYALEFNNVAAGSFDALMVGSGVTIAECHFHDIAGDAARFTNGTIIGCYFKNDGTKDFDVAIRLAGSGNVLNNIISIDGASDGINLAEGATARGNAILSSSGTGQGIIIGVSSAVISQITNNVVEGFSGTGGIGIDLARAGAVVQLFGANAYFNNTTNQSAVAEHIIVDLGDNEALSATGFEKSGSDTFANRFPYFKPKNEGNTQTGGWPEIS